MGRDGTWAEQDKLQASNADPQDAFGSSVALTSVADDAGAATGATLAAASRSAASSGTSGRTCVWSTPSGKRDRQRSIANGRCAVVGSRKHRSD